MSQTAALVRVSYGAHGIVQTDDGRQFECRYRRTVGRPCCGDRVMILPQEDGSAALSEILPRRNEFMRADAKQRPSVVAANLDQVLIVIAKRPLPSRDLLERYLLAVHAMDIKPLIVLNKVELPDPEKETAGSEVLDHMNDYLALGYRVLHTSCKGPPGSAVLEPVLRDQTSILVGQSGVGKSSLARRILPDLDIQIGALSKTTGKGTHTTTTTTLYDIPGGGHLIDSPGVWEYGLWRLEPLEIASGFPEFRPFLGACRFNDCLHRSEPGCAIKQAVTEGRLLEWRYRSYLRILEQN